VGDCALERRKLPCPEAPQECTLVDDFDTINQDTYTEYCSGRFSLWCRGGPDVNDRVTNTIGRLRL